MINALMFFLLPSGGNYKINYFATLPLSEHANKFSNKPYLIYGWAEEGEFWYFAEDFPPSAAALLLKEVYK